tara:strand:- start:203 stop:904 length:702 start_codon:yes stop_codon:yes gene_type:complete
MSEPHLGPQNRIQIPFAGRQVDGNTIYNDYDFKENPGMRKRMNQIFRGRDFGWDRHKLFSAISDMRGMMPGVSLNDSGAIVGGYDPREKAYGIVQRLFDKRMASAKVYNQNLKSKFANYARRRGITSPEALEQYRQYVNAKLGRRNAGHQIPAADKDYPDSFNQETQQKEWNRNAYQWVHGHPEKPVPPAEPVELGPDPNLEVPSLGGPKPNKPQPHGFMSVSLSPQQFPFYG